MPFALVLPVSASAGDAVPGRLIVSFKTATSHAAACDALDRAGARVVRELSGISGTSMAAPYVAGAAAMLRAKDSDLSYSDVKSALKKTVDKLPALSGKTVTGGRIDLGRALGSVG